MELENIYLGKKKKIDYSHGADGGENFMYEKKKA